MTEWETTIVLDEICEFGELAVGALVAVWGARYVPVNRVRAAPSGDADPAAHGE